MSDEQQPPYPPAPPPPRPPVPASQRFPTWKQAFVMFGGGIALAISACFGCLFTVDYRGRANAALDGLTMVLGILVFVGVIATFVGAIFVLMRILRGLFGKKDESGSPS
jgi:hypothetical protein